MLILSWILVSLLAIPMVTSKTTSESHCKSGFVNNKDFNPLQHSGGASPYFVAPSQFGISGDLPQGCVVDQASYTLRHGSRYPEPGSFQGWVDLHTKFQNNTYTAKGPLTFLPSWKLPVEDPPNQTSFLSVTGGGEAFALGVDLRKRYGFTSGGTPFTVWAASQQRVLDTASFFLQGYLAGGHYDASALGRIVSLPDSVNFTFANSLTASAACPNYVNNVTLSDNYRAATREIIAARLNEFLDGLVLTGSDIGPMMDLCGFQTEISGSSPFCDVFTPDEWEQYAYGHDLQYYYGSGPGNPLAATTMYPYVQAISDLFELGPGKTTTTATFIPPPLLMGFTHDNDVPPILAVLGLLNNTSYAPLDPLCPNTSRKYRASYIVSFRGTVALERLSCDNTWSKGNTTVHHIAGSVPLTQSTSQYVRVKVNDAVVPIPQCTSGPGSSCPLSQFATVVRKRGELAGDFVQKCGLSGVSNATSTLNFFTNPPD